MTDRNPAVLSVSEINRMARVALEKSLPCCWIKGELSNLTRATSGHWYFSIKDMSASARCVMFRVRNQLVAWHPREGEQIEIRAQASLYEPRGDFQLIVDVMRQAGRGNLYEAFLRLKEKLQQEGLFDAGRKKDLPKLPRRIGVITSPQAAALRDVLTTLRRRWPFADLVIYPCAVQGETAPAQILQAILAANQRSETDVLLLVRGGGSIEDLWAFNDEGVAKAIAASRIPIISGIGHETDFTIADFVADLRAPTPTGAAQLATPEAGALLQKTLESAAHLSRHMRSLLQSAWQHRDHLHNRLRHPRAHLQNQARLLAHLTQRLVLSGQREIASRNSRRAFLHSRLLANKPTTAVAFERLKNGQRRLTQAFREMQARRVTHHNHLNTQLSLLCPTLVLNRGYSIVRSQLGEVIYASEQVKRGQHLAVELAQGNLEVDVIDIEK